MGAGMTFEQIVDCIRRDHGGAWWALFHVAPEGHRFLPTGDVLTPRAYDEIRRRFGAQVETVEELTVEERKRNHLRGLADASDSGGRKYG